MNKQPLEDDAELLRSLKPTRPEINWQKVKETRWIILLANQLARA